MHDNKEYAKLLSSIKTAKTNLKRVLSPIETAHQIKRLMNEEGTKATESLLPLSKNLILAFTNLLNLPEECHDAIVWGESCDHGVGFFAANHISTLNEKKDQLLLFRTTSKLSISENDVRQIISFYKKNDILLEDAITKITNARPQISHTYLVIISLSDYAKEQLAKQSQLTKQKPEKLLEQYFSNKFQVTITNSIQLKGQNIAIELNELFYKKYKNKIFSLGLEYHEIIDYIVR